MAPERSSFREGFSQLRSASRRSLDLQERVRVLAEYVRPKTAEIGAGDYGTPENVPGCNRAPGGPGSVGPSRARPGHPREQHIQKS